MNDTAPPDGETDPFTLAAQERWLDLARLGRKAWNEWANLELKKPRNQRKAVSLTNQPISLKNFGGFLFPGVVIFEGCLFESEADFRRSVFYGDANFQGAEFSHRALFFRSIFMKEANFFGAKFRKDSVFIESFFHFNADFSNCKFGEDIDFSDAIFRSVAIFFESEFMNQGIFMGALFNSISEFDHVRMASDWQLDGVQAVGSLSAKSASIQGHAYLTNISFHVPPDLISTAFSQPPSFRGSNFWYPRSKPFLGKCSLPDGKDRFQRLKQLAADTHDHELELRLFAHETKAKRFHSLKPTNPLHWPGLVLNFAYEWASDFGQSVLRPLGWLLMTVVCALFAYETMTGRPDMLGRGLIEFSDAAKVAAVANVFPFAGQAEIGREIMTTGLCPMPEDSAERLDCLTALYTISAVEGVFGLIFLFLIGLGLRNRFRIK